MIASYHKSQKAPELDERGKILNYTGNILPYDLEGKNMNADQSLRKELLALLEGQQAHMTFEQAVADFRRN
ncbi:MAG: hypothetical protein U0694_07425 [Anaerolineae bacterium]